MIRLIVIKVWRLFSNVSCTYLDAHEEGDGEGDDDQEDRDDGQEH